MELGGMSRETTESSENGRVVHGETSATTTPSAALLHSSQSLPDGFSSSSQWHHNIQEADPMDGFRVTTLVGVGGMIGWTAAAAYRWLNGGDFSMFPPPPTTSASAMNTPAERSTTSFPNTMNSKQHETFPRRTPTHWNNGRYHQKEQPEVSSSLSPPRTDKLAETVQSLVEALQKQSTDHGEIIKRLSEQIEKQQTNESMQRLRREQTTNESSNDAAAVASNMALFCKLAEIQAELSSLRRDIHQATSPTSNDSKWDERLSCTLTQVESCIAKLNPSESGPSDASVMIDATPIRPTTNWQKELMTTEDSANKVQKKTEMHAVAAALRTLVLDNEVNTLRVGAQLLYLYVINLASHPTIPRYRKIFTSNESFQRVDTLKGGRELLRAVGFQDSDNALEWEPGTDKEEYYLSLLGDVSTALGILKSPGQATKEELLDKVLVCLSSFSVATTTPATKEEQQKVGTTTGEEECLLPTVYKTPDPSILSPPATKKQVMHSNPAVSFTPSILETSAASAGNGSLFPTDNDTDNSNDKETPMESLVDADNVWK